jgi:histidinol dehydrogenase
VQGKRSFEPVSADTRAIAATIIDDVKARGEAALLHHAVRLGDIREGESYVLDRDALKQQYDTLPIEQQQLLTRVAARISAFASTFHLFFLS